MAMTSAAVPAVRAEAAVADVWVPRIAAGRYDPAARPAAEKAGVTIGMAMTEKQGGSAVRANTTRPAPAREGRSYRLTARTWFRSAPICDAFVALPYSAGRLPRFLHHPLLPDSTSDQ